VRHYKYSKRAVGPNDKTLDLDPKLKPDFLQDAREPLPTKNEYRKKYQRKPEFNFLEYWDGILIDPPYTKKDAEHYKPGPDKLPNARSLIENSLKVVKPFGRVGLLHYLSPSIKHAKLVAMIGVTMGFNNRIRVFTVYEKEA